MGVMAAFGRSIEIQQYACSILSQLALYQPTTGEKVNLILHFSQETISEGSDFLQTE